VQARNFAKVVRQMKTIDFETHFATQGWVDALYSNPGNPRFAHDPQSKNRRLYYFPEGGEPFGDVLLEKLLEMGAPRIKAMDEAGVDVAVVSLTAPGIEQFETAQSIRLAREANDILADAVTKYPDRYRGYAALPVRDVDASVKELERGVKDLGLIGWKTHCNYGDSYLDEKRYWPILAKAEELDVPIYLHPTVPKIAELRTYGVALSGPPFGFGVETAMVMLRLILSGAFDAFPKLKVVLGHYGEFLPFLMHRIDWAYTRPHVISDIGATPPLKRKPSDYLRENMWVSTSGNYLAAAFKCTQDTLGMDRILLGTDHPYDSMAECQGFLESLGLTDQEMALLYNENAAALGVTA
jgi:predicted TIM-barrel fold metal-dependent hydrolase